MKSHIDLGKYYHPFDETSTVLGNIIILLMQPCYCSDATQQSFRPRNHLTNVYKRYRWIETAHRNALLGDCNHLCKLLQKIPSNRNGESHARVFCNHLASFYKRYHPLLQKIVASQKTNTSHHMLLLSLVIILQSCYKKIMSSQETNTSHRMLLSFDIM